MKVISAVNQSVLNMLKMHRKPAENYRKMHFCIEKTVDDGVLVYNLLTKELILLSKDEYEHFFENEYLKEHWFAVPEDTKEKDLTDMIHWAVAARQKETKAITSYTIFTTMDCNARCFYCFELGRKRIPMNKETALKVVDYIVSHCEGNEVRLSWFGGEPLFNSEVIDIICDGLRKANIEYKSFMVSNGYLFDDETVRKAVEKWNLERIQITLDGTEATYNKIKAYIYREGNPYQIVLANIGRLLDALVQVQIRLNMGAYNAEDLLRLVDELADRFAGNEKLYIYAHHLFDLEPSRSEARTDDEWTKRDTSMRCLEEKIAGYGFESKMGIQKKIRLHRCMADGGKAVTILPDGNIGLCEHFSDTEHIGHIDRDGFDQKVVESWKERSPAIAACDECFYYPSCVRLKKCASSGVCYPQERAATYRSGQRSVYNEYCKWKKTEKK